MPTPPSQDTEAAAPVVGPLSLPPLNLEQYREHLKGLDLSDAQVAELLETLRSILSAFVDQAFGVDSILLARPQHQDGPAETDAAAQRSPSAH